jgi:hypothetical protein
MNNCDETKVCSEHSGIKVGLENIILSQKEIKEELKSINEKLERLPVLWEFHDTTRKMVYGAYAAIMAIVGWIFVIMKG